MSSTLESVTYGHGRLFGRAEAMLGRLACPNGVSGVGGVARFGVRSSAGARAAVPAQDPAPRFKSAVDLVSVSAVVQG